MMAPQNREHQETDTQRSRGKSSTASLGFPALVWPFDRDEGAVQSSRLEALGVGLFGCMLPGVGADRTVRWHAAAAAPVRDRTQARSTQRGVVLRAATQVPGLLDLQDAPAPKAMVLQFERAHPELDLSRELLEELFYEHSDGTQVTTQASAIAVCRSQGSATDSASRECVFFASGETKAELWTQPLRSDSKTRAFCAMKFSTAIRQIKTQSAHPGLACVRTDSMTGLVRMVGNGPGLPLQISGTPYDYGASGADQWICDAAWNPWVAPELALASSTGAVRLWDCSAGRETNVLSGSSSNRQQWSVCDFWGAPRMLLCANQTTLSCLDSRASKTQTVFLDTTKSAFVHPGEIVTAARASESHPMHAIVASTHSIRIYDRRYTRQPLLAWALSSPTNDPPVRIESTVVGERSVLVAATASAEISVFEYSQHTADAPFVSNMQTALSLPPTSLFAMQDALAVDPATKTAPVRTKIEGLAVYTGMDGHTVCLTLDALGGIAAVQLGSPVESTLKLEHSHDSAEEHCSRREYAWSLIRQCGVPFERVDMCPVYCYLADGPQASEKSGGSQSSSAKTNLDSSQALGLISPLAGVANPLPEDASAHAAALLVAADLVTTKPSLRTELPSWTPVGKSTYRKAFAQDTPVASSTKEFVDQLRENVMPSAGNSQIEAPTLFLDSRQESHKTVRAALELVFGACSSNSNNNDNFNRTALADRALDRAAADVALCKLSIGPKPECSTENLREKLGKLPEHAQLLDNIWSGASLPGWSRSNESLSQHFASSRKGKTKSSLELRSSLTQPPALARAPELVSQTDNYAEFFSQPIPGVSSTAPQIRVPSLAFASSSGPTQPGAKAIISSRMPQSQVKKKTKLRKSGF
ncbi:TATA box-binding protein-associated factor RNA polymerase I subunit C [Coemansia sp. RSA 1722]|nr:TATA box-binding protein-associated factor RNA polymerase I subunit C [Coemansia sp. RSA 1722]